MLNAMVALVAGALIAYRGINILARNAQGLETTGSGSEGRRRRRLCRADDRPILRI